MTDDLFKHIQLLLLDVDGVLTDGSIIYDDRGGELKIFNVKDGLGIRLLQKAGISVGIVTGRASAALEHRCRDLGIRMIFQGVADKAALLDDIAVESGLHSRNIAFMGDDLPDLPLLKKVGLAIAVSDAHPAVREASHHITAAAGGAGAVREICEAILKARQLWSHP